MKPLSRLVLALALLATAGCPSSGKPESCTDGKLNGPETDIDCGGSCVPCGLGAACQIAKDCLSLVCSDAVCVQPAAPTCSDGLHNGIETDVDCGGGCSRCTDGKLCAAWTDCESAVCSSSRCTPPSCADNTKNGGESDIDCGGSCFPCADLKLCAVAGDCVSGVCAMASHSQSQRCVIPSCSDKVVNGTETDADCGGTCAKCPAGKGCGAPGDCDSNVCASSGTCAAPACNDASKNGGETDVDCGGACNGCDDGKTCSVAKDCVSGNCSGGRCVAASCNDKIKNGSETDVDCGGTCAACIDGKSCALAKDCTSALCSAGKCAIPTCSDNTRNGSETDIDCGGTCAACIDGKSCAVENDCRSKVCGAIKRCSAVTALVPAPEAGISARPSVLDAEGTLHSVVAVGDRLIHLRRSGNSLSEQTIATFTAPEVPLHPFFNGTGGAMYRLAINASGKLFLLFATNRGPAARDANVPYLATYTAAGGWTRPVELRNAGLFPRVSSELDDGLELAVDSQNNLHVLAAHFIYAGAPGFGFLDYYRWDPSATTLVSSMRLHATAAGNPVLFIDAADQLHVVHDDYQANTPISYRTSSDAGVTWSAPTAVAMRTGSGDRALGLAVLDQGTVKRRFVARRTSAGQLEILASTDGTSFNPAFTSNEPFDHASPTLLAIGGQLHCFFLGPARAGGKVQLGRVIMTEAGVFGAVEHLEDTTVYTVSYLGIAGSTWPAFNRPQVINLLKHWSTASPTTGLVLINRL